MYGSGTTAIFEGLPDLRDLSGESVRRVLSTVYAEILAHRLAGNIVATDDAAYRHAYLRRLAAALESYAVFDSDVMAERDEARNGAAFIAAEALTLAADLPASGRGTRYPYRLAHPPNLARLEAGLLYSLQVSTPMPRPALAASQRGRLTRGTSKDGSRSGPATRSAH